MNLKFNFKENEIKKILKNMVVYIDTREDVNKDAIKFIEKKGFKIEYRKLEFGDYSCGIKKNEEIGMPFDISLENEFCIELKANLEEISNNLTKKRTEFENEFIRAKHKGAKIHMIIENGSWEDIQRHNYNTDFNEKSFYNSLLSFQQKFNLDISFCGTEISGLHIIRIFQIYLRNIMKE